MNDRSILFLCTGNSCRSQMAEALMNHLSDSRFAAQSAGSVPAGYVHPMAIRVMGERGIDISANRSKSLNEFLGDSFDYVITVCDRAKESCPIFPGKPTSAHWGFEDPAEFVGSEEETLQEFRRIANLIENRIRLFLETNEV